MQKAIQCFTVLLLVVYGVSFLVAEEKSSLEKSSTANTMTHFSFSVLPPRPDRLVDGGAVFTDWYSRQSCTSAKTAFANGLYPFYVRQINTGLQENKEAAPK
jgi:hypothetical protein